MDSDDDSGSEENNPLFPDYDDNDSDKSMEEGLLPIDEDDETGEILNSSDDENMERGEEDSDDDDGIDASAWGKKRHTYYSTDYVDKDFGGFEGSDAELAEEEEQEALTLQRKLTEQLDDADFGTSIFEKSAVKQTEDDDFGKISINVSDLNTAEKLKLLNTESPELMRLIDDVKEKLQELGELANVMEEERDLLKSDEQISDYFNTKVQLILHYSMNALLYLSMKTKRTQVSNHPVRKRIVNFSQLLDQLVSYQELKSIRNNLEDEKTTADGKISRERTLSQNPLKKQRVVSFNEELNQQHEIGGRVQAEPETSAVDVEQSDKRAINYQIAKNRGLTPHRKKDYKNPRVKHRMKFKKAKIRRRGQVREPRTEINRYGGEISGIKIGVKKGIKLK